MESITLRNLEFQRANQNDWAEILNLLDETKLSYWFTGSENSNNFFHVKESGKLISCFAIYQKDDIGILKSFGVSKNHQGKGLGKHIAHNIIPSVCKDLKIKKLFLLADNAEPFFSLSFWERTDYTRIEKEKVTEPYIQEYFEDIRINFPQYIEKEVTFYLDIN